MPEPAPHVEVLGFDCRACRKTHRLIASAAERLGVSARLEKVSDPARIMALGVLALPGVAVDGRLVHQGGVPDARTIDAALTRPTGASWSPPLPGKRRSCSRDS